MYREKHVRILIRVDGTCAIDALHFTDAGCRQATQQITQALAGTTVSEHLKPEALVPARHSQTRQEASR